MPRGRTGPGDFRTQPVWRSAFRITIEVYDLASGFPSFERSDGLAVVMRKCVSSLGAHIADGCSQQGWSEAALLFQIALGETSELLHHLLVSRELGYINAGQLDNLENELSSLKEMLVVELQEMGSGALPAVSAGY